MIDVGCSGTVRPGTGIGIVQRELYPRLIERGYVLHESGNRDLPGGFGARLRGFLVGLTPARGRYELYLSVVPPLPVGLRVPVVTVVHDLRWRDTRSGVAQRYRRADLRRTVARSTHLICISDRTRRDLVDAFPEAEAKATVARLGPGLAGSASQEVVAREPGLFLLVGGALHKKNELAARAIVEIAKTRDIRVVGVGVSREVRATVEGALPDGAYEWRAGISDTQMADLYRRADYFVLLSEDEGFGLPFVEALTSGCNVVAVDQPLTRELLGDAAILIRGDDPVALARQITATPGPHAEEIARVAAQYSWDLFTDQVAQVLQETRGSAHVRA
ncbi:glycosyltransferase [Microbacterium sp. SMR1]|uniref:glycosyltransferase n=1 Tax=Microbacterium sp. SMR1 TaxID=1497340 RepID=UPI0015EB6066|nr:glycosyltransferase [Microbacterium sp. SMR1]